MARFPESENHLRACYVPALRALVLFLSAVMIGGLLSVSFAKEALEGVADGVDFESAKRPLA